MAFRPISARPPATLLREAQTLSRLFQAAKRLEQLQSMLELQLQPAAREYCKVASWREGCLLLIVTDANWATRLRYQERRLVRELGKTAEFAGIQRLLFKVQPQYSTEPRPAHRLQISPQAAADVHASAEHIRDPRLRAALERIASHAQTLTTESSP